MRSLSWIVIVLLAQSLAAQQASTEATTRYALSGLVNPEQIGDLFLVDEASRPAVKPVGIIRINAGATGVSAAAFRVVDGKWELIVARELVPLVFAIEKPGNWMVAVQGSNVTGPPFFNLVVGGTPIVNPPPVEPPTGDFAAIAAHSKQLAATLNDPPTAAAITTRLANIAGVPNPDLLSARKSVSAAIDAALLSRTGASKFKFWEDIWRRPIASDIEALANAGRIPNSVEYLRLIKALAESLR